MHTLIVVAVGFGVLALCLLLGKLTGFGLAAAALLFLPLWLIGAAINMYLGVKTAGYSIADETPVLLIVFAIPAAAALVIWWRMR
jgi:hypothetical protein